jgi:hypothetical protein
MRPESVLNQSIAIGPTSELSLRVSVATLSRVVFPHPDDAVSMLALEHKATLISDDTGSQVITKAQPFGGAVRITDTNLLGQIAGTFNFDSEKSREERDFRIYIRPSSWEAVRNFCIQQMSAGTGSVLEHDPARELVEEFEDALGIQLEPDQYTLNPIGIALENEPVPTANPRAAGYPTVRIYQVDEAQIQDPGLCRSMVGNSQMHPFQVLSSMARNNARDGGQGRANAMLVAPLEQVRDAILATPLNQRGEPMKFKDTLLDGNVGALFNDIAVPRYFHIVH